MSESPLTTIDYSLLIESSLRSVVRDVLAQVADEGLPGEHHFLLTFRTTYPGVGLPSQLLAQYPDEMTIVVQHQFRDLLVTEEAFSVYLRFSGVEHGITVPFGALTRFLDPSVKFDLHFRHFSEVEGSQLLEETDEDETIVDGPTSSACESESGKVLSFEKAKRD